MPSGHDWSSKGPTVLKLQGRRGPDCIKFETFPEFSVGHLRLSIQDIRTQANQPMWDCEGQFVLTYNGEIYNLQELTRLIREAGIVLRTNSDTEVLLELCKLVGVENAISKIDGMFSFVFYDRKSARGWAARDRFGQKPLYYCTSRGRIACSSSAMALAKGYGLNKPNLVSYQIFLATRGITLPDYSFFRDIHVLPAGHVLSFDSSGYNVSHCIDLDSLVTNAEQEAYVDSSPLEIKELARSKLEKSVNHHAISDVPIGVSLSGGIDSSLVYNYLKNPGLSFRTFTKLSPGIESIPSEVVPLILAKKPSHAVFVRNAASSYLDKLRMFVEWCGFPPPWGGGVPMADLCENARESGCKVLIGGDCADEMLGGYESYKYSYCTFRGNDLMLSNQVGLIDKYLSKNQEAIDTYLDFNSKVRKSCLKRYDKLEGVTRYMQATLLHDCKVFLQCCVLPHSDAYSMMHGIEMRNPFLGLDFFRFCMNLPLEYKIAQIKGSIHLKKILLELAISDIGPFMDQPKEGTRNYSLAVSDPSFWDLNSFSVKEFFDFPKQINRNTMFKLICLEIFHRLFIMGNKVDWNDLLTQKGRVYCF